MNDKKTCFVITPIGDDNSDIRRHIDGIIDQVIVPTIGEKYDIVVSHREFEIGSINDKIIKSIYESDLVIANLTTTNPNVMFELGIRYSFGKPAIVIAEKGTKLPFDVIDENTIFYVNDLVGANDLRKEISKYEEKIDIEKKDYGPVFKVINKIPLYSEVESGKDVSNKKLLEYIIDRLDIIEKNMSTTNKRKEKTTDSAICVVSFQYGMENNKDENLILDRLKEIKRKYEDLVMDITKDVTASGNYLQIIFRGSVFFVTKARTELLGWTFDNNVQRHFTDVKQI